MMRQFPILRQNIKALRTCPPNESGAEDYFRIADHSPRTSSFASQNPVCGPGQAHVRNAGLSETDRLATEMRNRLRQEDN